MYTYANKTQENKTRSVANRVANNNSRTTSTAQFVDNRPLAIQMRKLQERENNSRQGKQPAQLMADNYSSQQQPMQRKENKTCLPDNLKSGVENLSGYSMDNVKVHYNSDKPAQLQAHGFAQGTDIHLGPGQEKHLPHEAWHVVQQKQGRVKPTLQMKEELAINDDANLEQEADAMGAKALQLDAPHFSTAEYTQQTTNGSAPLQLKLLGPEEIYGAVADIEFGGDLILKKIRLGDKGFKTPQNLSLAEYALAKMNSLKGNWEGRGKGLDNHYNALLLSYTVDVVADYISRTDIVNLPRIKPVITQKLIHHFKTEISRKIKQKEIDGIGEEDIQMMLRVAESLNGKDPITLYMKDILPLEKADAMIREMADSAKIPVTQYFELLHNQFLDQLLSLSSDQVAIGQAINDETKHNSGNDFPLQEVVGEISGDFHQYIIGQKENYKPADNHLLQETAKNRLQGLRDAIKRPLKEVKQAQQQQDPTSNVVTFIQEITGVPPEKAAEIQQQLMQHLATLAPIVTVKHDMWFNAEGLITTDTAYKSILGAQHTREEMSGIVKPDAEGTIDTLGRSGEGPRANLLKERGPRYLRWRLDKDSRAEGIDVPFNVYPIYGCLDYWDVSQWGAGGTNYYGDVHFLLKNTVKERCFYKFTDAGIKRGTLLGLFNDLILKHKATAAVILGDVIAAVVAARPTTRIEVVVPGGINVLEDVKTIVVTSTVPQEVAKAIELWALQNAIGYLGETEEMDARNRSGQIHEPVLGLHDQQVADIAKPQYQSIYQTSLVGVIRDKVNEAAWNSKGSGFLGSKKTPSGIAKLRTIFNSHEAPAKKLTEGIAVAAQWGSWEASTTDFYRLFAFIDIQSAENMKAFELSISRFDVEKERID